MMNYGAILGWITMGLLCSVVELKTPGLFYFLSFALGSAAAAVSAWYAWVPEWQMMVFLAASAVSFFFLSLCVGVVHKTVKNHKTNTDALPGKQGVVTRLIPVGKIGQVRVGGELWSAQSVQGQFEVGTTIVVERVEGVRLIVKNF